MPCKSDQAFGAIKPLRWIRDLTAVELINIRVENLGAIQRNNDSLPLHFDLLKIPLPRRTEVSVLRADAVINLSMVLIRRQAILTCGGLFFVVAVAVDDLQLKPIRCGSTT